MYQVNKEELFDLYVTQKLAIDKCAKYFGVSSTVINNRLNLYNIPKREKNWSRESDLVIPMTDKMYQILRGALLGDGSLAIAKNRVNARFTYCSKSKQHVEFVTRDFLEYGQISEKDRYDKRTNKYYHQCQYFSKVSKTFTEEYNKWYINKIKHIPNDLTLTSLTCLIWYIGDGCLRNDSKSNTQDIILATNSFEKNEIEQILLPQLSEFEAKLYRVKNEQYAIRIGRKTRVKEFLNYIGKCPFEDYNYKWAIKDNIRAGAGQSIYFNDDKEFIFLYEYGFSANQIAKIYGCSEGYVGYVLHKNNIPMSKRFKNINEIDFEYLNDFKYDKSHKDYEIMAIDKLIEANAKKII